MTWLIALRTGVGFVDSPPGEKVQVPVQGTPDQISADLIFSEEIEPLSWDGAKLPLTFRNTESGWRVLRVDAGRHQLVFRHRQAPDAAQGKQAEQSQSLSASLTIEPEHVYLIRWQRATPGTEAGLQFNPLTMHHAENSPADEQKALGKGKTPGDSTAVPKEKRAQVKVAPLFKAPQRKLSGLAMLKYWWWQAGKKDREGFLEWLNPEPKEEATKAPPSKRR